MTTASAPTLPALLAGATAGLLFALAVIALALFGAAGTVHQPRAWAYLAVFAASSVLVTAHLVRHDRALLERRLRAGPGAEPEPRQKLLSALAALVFVALYGLCGLDARFAWSRVPVAVSVLAEVLVAGGFAIVFLTFRANSFTSATIAVAEDQPLTDTGPYAVVRHPMYAGALLMIAVTPVALGSWVALAAVPPFVAAVVGRLLAEERTLREELRGYAAYQSRVRYRLVPGLW
jgi:protein-S-isoprenylcysteine O-methyltransferase Ste14